MTEKQTTVTVKELPMPCAEPAPLGLIGLAVAALVLGLQDLGYPDSGDKSLMIPWAIFLGATAQLIAGIMDYKRNNIFGATAFTAYSLLWYSVGLTLIITIFLAGDGDVAGHDDWQANPSLDHYAYGLLGFLFFSLILTAASAMTNKALFGILIGIDFAIFTLVGHILWDWGAEPVGVFLLIVSALSFYTAGAVLINTMADQTILPLGSPIWVPKKPESAEKA